MLLANQASFSKDNLEKLYKEGHSMTEMAKLLSCSVHKIVYWMSKYNLKRRNLSQAIYLKSNPKGDPFSIKTNLNAKEMFLLGLGLGIYWGKGEKTSKDKVRVSNSNPEIIKAFIEFLLGICRLERRKLLYQVICFNDSDVAEVRIYWARKLKIPENSFGKIIKIPTQGKGTYKNKSSNGVCILTVASIKLKPWLMEKIGKINQCLDGSVEERILGKN